MEIWRDIIGYEGYYQISNFGNVKSLDNYRKGKDGTIKFYKGKILKGNVNNIGYLCFDLYKEKKRKNIKSHFLVASHFVDGYKKGLVVNHKDGNKLNNNYRNLEWVTFQQNMIHAVKYRLMVKHGHIVIHLPTGVFFESIKQAYRTGIVNCSVSHFKNMLNGKRKNISDFILA